MRIVFIISICAMLIACDNQNNTTEPPKENKSAPVVAEAPKVEKAKVLDSVLKVEFPKRITEKDIITVEMNKPLELEWWDVMVKKATLQKSVTLNYEKVNAGDGNQFLMLNLTYKNTSHGKNRLDVDMEDKPELRLTNKDDYHILEEVKTKNPIIHDMVGELVTVPLSRIFIVPENLDGELYFYPQAQMEFQGCRIHIRP